MRESMLLAAIQDREEQGTVLDLRDAKITLVQSELSEIIDQLSTSMLGDDEGQNELCAGIGEGMKEALEEFYRDNNSTVFSPITDTIEDSNDTLERIADSTDETSRLAEFRSKAIQKLLQMKFFLLIAAVWGLAHAMEKIEGLLAGIKDAVNNINMPSLGGSNADPSDAAERVAEIEQDLRNQTLNDAERQQLEEELVHGRSDLAGAELSSVTPDFKERVDSFTSDDIRRVYGSLEAQTRLFDPETADRLGFRTHAQNLEQMEYLRRRLKEIEPDGDITSEPENTFSPIDDIWPNRPRWLGGRGKDRESPLPEGAFTLPPEEQTPEMEPLTILPTTRRLFEAAMDSIISPAHGSYVDEHDPAMFDDDSPFKPSTIELMPDEMESSVTGQSGLMPAPSAALIEKMENTSGGGSSRVTLNPTNVNVPVTNVTNNNSNIISPMPSPRNDNSSVLTFKNEQLVPNW